MGLSYTVSADRLSLHRNSVKYRIVKAAEERGRPFDGDRLDVELALQVCHFLGSAVMTSPSS
ncbi:MAG: helix-turn-helix domain-containing protein [Actinomycetota bacterium]|nr:helix-turn-helix domain-containing protein [Actinomycetota bacterium]